MKKEMVTRNFNLFLKQIPIHRFEFGFSFKKVLIFVSALK